VPETGDESIRELILKPYRIVYVLREPEILIALVHHAARPLTVADLPADL
jgi:hypothetical protein